MPVPATRAYEFPDRATAFTLPGALAPRLAVEPSAAGIVVREIGALVTPRRLALAWHRDR